MAQRLARRAVPAIARAHSWYSWEKGVGSSPTHAKTGRRVYVAGYAAFVSVFCMHHTFTETMKTHADVHTTTVAAAWGAFEGLVTGLAVGWMWPVVTVALAAKYWLAK